MQIGAGGAPAHPSLLRDLIEAEALLAGSVEIIVECQTLLRTGLNERDTQRVRIA